MRKVQKEQALGFLTVLEQAHEEIKTNIRKGNLEPVLVTLTDCQDGAIALGELIEAYEGEGFVTISYLEKYCEVVYGIYQKIAGGEAADPNKIEKALRKALIAVGNSVRNDVRVRTEIVFFPYKVSMWDSLESIYQAAKADPDCDAYCVPIPYYDRNPDGSLGTMHYEGRDYPSDIEVIDWTSYHVAERRPDAVFIHNPYDDRNFVTSVHPQYYSSELKKYTDTLVYVPYYATAGGLGEGQKLCPAYFYVDYIVVQAEKYKKLYDPLVPQKKFLALGSPKFDRVIRLCKNPPEAPAAWQSKMAGKKVYFYNTSLNGMLADTGRFLEKMEYVFRCFEQREDACLIWRPHPLMESTFASMRAGYKPIYDELRRRYLASGFGIYDDTPDINHTIALCDAYIGDAGTSVTSLFGIAGKPLFILNNRINTLPEEEDWRGGIIRDFPIYGNDEWMVTQGNKLYRSVHGAYDYRYFCDLCEYGYGDYYNHVVRVNGRDYVCPANAQDILLIGEQGIERRIRLEQSLEQKGAFYGAVGSERYLFLIPNQYPAIVRYDTVTDKVDYYREHLDVFTGDAGGKRRVGGFRIWKEYLFLASPVDNHVLAVHMESGRMQVMTTNAKNQCGCNDITADGNDLWLMPYEGRAITRWNPETGEMREYTDFPETFTCHQQLLGYECEELPFYHPVFDSQYVYLTPFCGNMYLRLDKETGEMTKWLDRELPQGKNGYYVSSYHTYFVRKADGAQPDTYLLFSGWDKKLYTVHIRSGEFEEIPIHFDREELEEHEPGFCEFSQWLQYVCEENAFHTLPDFLDGRIAGEAFDQERQLKAYGVIAANNDGTCGEKLYTYIKEQTGAGQQATQK